MGERVRVRGVRERMAEERTEGAEEDDGEEEEEDEEEDEANSACVGRISGASVV